MNRLGSTLQPLLELLDVGNPQDLTDEQIVKFREWLQAAYEHVADEAVEATEVLPVKPIRKPINTQATSAHVDRVLEAILAWQGPARKRIARRGQRAVKRVRHSPVGSADRAQSLSSATE